MSLQQPVPWASENYLAFEHAQTDKHEFQDGRLFCKLAARKIIR